jgi:hypothetical protein
MYYSLIINFLSLHVHVIDLKPFQVGLSDIGLTRHHCVNRAGVALCVVHPLPNSKTLEDEKERDATNTSTPNTCKHQ